MATNLISGLSSGFDWKTMVDQLIAIDHQRVDQVTNKQKEDQTKLGEWQAFNTKLLALKTAVGNLKDSDAFNLYKTSLTTDSPTFPAADLIAVTASTEASIGSYTLKVNELAVAQKLSSNAFASLSTELGAAYAGDIVINGTSISIGATDTLTILRDKINSANSGSEPTGVTASIISYNATDKRLLLTSDNTGATGMAIENGGAPDILAELGFTDTEGGFSDVVGVTGDLANTSGDAAITTATLIKDIDGYTGWAADDYIIFGGTDTSGGGVSDDTFKLAADKTVGDLLMQIESLFGNVTASITSAGKIMVVDNTTGSSNLSVTLGVKNLAGGTTDDTLKFDANGDLGSATSLRKRQLVAGADASITVEGVTVTRSTNMIDDILSGVTLNLVKADPDRTISINVGRDIDAIMTKINAFVTSYNSISAYINTQTAYDAAKKQTGGILFGDGTLASVKSDLTSQLTQTVCAGGASYATLGLVGINVDRVGQLSVNNSKLRGYLQTNFNDLVKLFTTNGTTSAGSLEYVSHGLKTNAGEYAVHIETAATQSASAPSDNSSLAGDETLTITAGDKAMAINLTAGMTMAQIVDTINSELELAHTQALASTLGLYADAGHTTRITAATKWGNVHDSDGASANLANGDIISFSGTNIDGSAINGSYAITDKNTDSVQGLLSAIETSFGNEVKAAINDDGKVVLITDDAQDSSSVALTLDYGQAHDLNFGSFASANVNGLSGRYLMDITAAADGGNHLVLTRNSYGTGHGFSIHQLNGLLWNDLDQTVDNGIDVAGTINDEAATGTGQILKGDSGTDNIDSLRIRYTGSTDDVDAGTVSLSIGVGEFFDRALFNMIDSLEGYVSFKQQSVQSEISRYTTQIDDMEARLERKREMLINRFVIMEAALQKIQSQSAWLTAQTQAAANGWYRGSSNS